MPERSITTLQRLSAALLRRGRERVRGTDCWAVLVEVAVVVLGILIAFELDAWAKRREAAGNELELLQLLEEETQADLTKLKAIRDGHVEASNNFLLLARAVTDPRARGAYNRRGDGACNLLRLPAVRRQSAGPGGLGSGERLNLISDSPLRTLLRRADAERVFADKQLEYFRDSFERYAVNIEPHLRWGLESPADPQCRVDIGSLAADQQAVQLLPGLRRDQYQFSTYRDEEAEATRAILQRVRCLRADNCPDS